MKLSFFAKLTVLVVVGLVVVFVIDPLDPSTISTPFCLGIIMMGISLRQSMSLVTTASMIYSLMTVFALIRAHEYYVIHIHSTAHPYFWMFQRMGLFLVLCGLSMYLAYYRTATERTRIYLQDILGNLPAPVVISDATGIISYANEALCVAFKKSSAEIIGRRYVDHFMGHIQEGKAMRYYIEVFSGHDKDIHEIGLQPFNSPTPMTARLICVGVGPSRAMITLLSNPEETAQDASFANPGPV
jgi:PAS domain-containing protein